MSDKPPKPRPPDSFASFEAAARGQGTRRKARWAINPLRDGAKGERRERPLLQPRGRVDARPRAPQAGVDAMAFGLRRHRGGYPVTGPRKRLDVGRAPAARNSGSTWLEI
jgi:hypothetical protein